MSDHEVPEGYGVIPEGSLPVVVEKSTIDGQQAFRASILTYHGPVATSPAAALRLLAISIASDLATLAKEEESEDKEEEPEPAYTDNVIPFPGSSTVH